MSNKFVYSFISIVLISFWTWVCYVFLEVA